MIVKKGQILLDAKDFQILLLLLQNESPANIADFLGMRPPSLSERLQDLERAGLVQTSPGTVKHVKVTHALTKAAQTLITNVQIQIYKFD